MVDQHEDWIRKQDRPLNIMPIENMRAERI